MDSDVRLPKVSRQGRQYVEDSSVNIYDNNDSAFFDTEAAAELASNVAAAACRELAVGPTGFRPQEVAVVAVPLAGAMTMMMTRRRKGIDLSSIVNTFRICRIILETQLKPARMITKEKVQEVKDKMADISSTVVSSQTVSAHPAESSEQVEDADVIVPVSQPDSESVDVTENPPIDGEFTDKMLKDIDVYILFHPGNDVQLYS